MISLFHGTTKEVAEPLVGVGRKKVDFGQGFYLTKMKRQASLWAETIAERRMAATPVLNIVDRCLKFKGSVVLASQGGRNAR